MTGTEMVCPNCGCETFTAYETIHRIITINGERNVISEEKVVSSKQGDEIFCTECKAGLLHEHLVETSYFHEVIVPQRLEAESLNE